MKKFKKHKFISKEKLARSFDVYDMNLDLNTKENKFEVDIKDFVKVGYGQYSILNCDELYFKVRYIDYEGDNVKEIIPHKMLKDIFELKQLGGLTGYSKVKPVYKIMNRFGDSLDIEPSDFRGTYKCTLVGILIK